MKNGSRILTRQYILERVWTFDDLPGEDTVKAHLRSLRQKLKLGGFHISVRAILRSHLM
ncbi:hypothetical protein CBP16_04690 [Fischerella thermalis WC217]|nr:hypothetical protein CBP16_04690 [Fischerella thermalis WC217]